MSTQAKLVMGEIQGAVKLPAHIADKAAELAEQFFAAAEENEFSGDPVETYAIPLWAKRGGAEWLPDVAHLGYKPALERGELVASAGVDMHTDDQGVVLMVVLHNDGLTFRQGRVSHKAQVGDWFIFDDRQKHGMKEARGRATFVGWHIPLVPA